MFISVKVIIGTTTGEIQAYDIDTGQLVTSFQAHTEWINRLLTLPNNFLASASDDDTIKIWNTSTAAAAANWSLVHSFTNHTNDVWAMELISEDLLASGARDGQIFVWRLSTGQLVQAIDTGIGNGETIRCLKMLPNGLLASGDTR